MALLPEQREILKELINTATVASAELGVTLKRVDKFLENVITFIQENHSHLGDREYLLLFDPDNQGTQPLDLKTTLQNINHSKAIFRVDEDLKLIEAIDGQAALVTCSTMTVGKLGIRVLHTYIWELVNGVYRSSSDTKNKSSEAPGSTRLRRSVSELDQIINDHKEQSVDRQQGFIYWDDKANRTLKSDNGRTEEIFQHDLLQWLRLHIYDAIDVIAEPSLFGQDKHDIRILTDHGNYVIEIKWLGTNGKTSYKQPPRIDEGLVQVKLYLENDSKLICGYLVVYDGRSYDKHVNQSSYNTAFKHVHCEEPKVIFLESEAPSKASERIVKEHSK